MQQQLNAPGIRLFMAALLALFIASATLWVSTHQVWYGLTQGTASDGESVLLLPIPHQSPLRVLAIGNGAQQLSLTTSDLIEEPDIFEHRVELSSFIERQQRFHDFLQQGSIEVLAQGDTGDVQTLLLTGQPTRPLSSLPAAFWVQLITGVGGFLIGCWIVVLRPKDLAARCFMLTGVSLMAAALAAAVYSTRELALDPSLFNTLMLINQSGTIGFGLALTGLFLYFPKRLVSGRWTLVLLLFFAGWQGLRATGQFSSPMLSVYAPVLLFSTLILVLIALQWWHNRHDPHALASLRWLGLVTFATVSCFVVLAALPILMAGIPPVAQGVAFGFFLILYAGLALGLRRYRLFELDRWAFHLLLWVLAGLALVGLDLLFLSVLHWQQTRSLLLSLLICGFLYLPLRGWLWRKLVERPRPPARALFDAVIDIALAPNATIFMERWQQLLNTLYAPLHMEHAANQSSPALLQDGRALLVPAIIDAPALQLVLAEKGKRLFVPGDVKLAKEVLDMLHYAHANRSAREAGEREERQRIAQDLHDDLGSRLLTGLHQTDAHAVHDTINLAIADMRDIVRGLTGEQIPLEQSLAELRAETLQRFDSAGLAIEWPLPTFAEQQWVLDYRRNRQFMSLMRELFSNILRHASATQVHVRLEASHDKLLVLLQDNGSGYDGSGQRPGSLGMDNLHQRTQAMQGELHFEPQQPGTITRLSLPLIQASEAGLS